MSIKWKDHLQKTKELFTNKCMCCGNCIRKCQVGSYYEENDERKIMQEVKVFFEEKPCDLELVKKRAFLWNVFTAIPKMSVQLVLKGWIL